MKQLIPQSKIDEARQKSNDRILPKSAYEFDCGWDAGFQFALNEIQPLMVEFADYVYAQDCEMCIKTTQQLLEEFINSKNK